jgi:Ca-activated chloride channel homolog
MKKHVPFIFASMLALAACGASPEKLVNNGNEAYANQDYAGALAAYQEAQTELPELAEPHYNAANAHYRQGDFEGAQQEIEQTLLKDDGDLVQNSFYNLGNNFYQAQDLEQAIEAYKEALRLNPGDMEAKHNLELALQQQQQQQQEQNQDQQNQDQQNQDQQNQDQQNQGQQNQDQQNQDQQNQDQKEQNQNQSQDQQDQQKQNDRQQNNGQPQQVRGLTKEQAKQLLEAAAQDSQSLEEYLQQVLVVPGAPPAKDW